MSRNLTLSAQVFAWSLTVSLVVVLVCLIVFVGILLAGSGWITAGVHEGSNAMNSTLPEVRVPKSEDKMRLCFMVTPTPQML